METGCGEGGVDEEKKQVMGRVNDWDKSKKDGLQRPMARI